MAMAHMVPPNMAMGLLMSQAQAAAPATGLLASAAGALAAANGSRLAWGLASILFNLGARTIFGELTPAQTAIARHPLVRRAAVVCMCFLATRDWLLSVAMGAVLVLLLDGLLDERSRLCVLPGGLCHRQRARLGPLGAVSPGAPPLRQLERHVLSAVAPAPSPPHAPPPPPRQQPWAAGRVRPLQLQAVTG